MYDGSDRKRGETNKRSSVSNEGQLQLKKIGLSGFVQMRIGCSLT